MKLFFRLISTCLLVITTMVGNSQNIGINATGSTPNSSAILDISDVTKGLLIPRMTKAQRDAIPSPAFGLSVFQTTNDTGFYYRRNTEWRKITDEWQPAGSTIETVKGKHSIRIGDGTYGEVLITPILGNAGDIFMNMTNGNSTGKTIEISFQNDNGLTYDPMYKMGTDLGYSNYPYFALKNSLKNNWSWFVDTTNFMAVGHNLPKEQLDVNGAVRLGSTSTTNAGTIRWSGADFEGYNGVGWLSLTTGGSDNDWTINGNDVSHLLGTVYTTKFSSTYGKIVENVFFPGLSPDDTALYVTSNSPKPTAYFEDTFNCGGCGSNAIVAYSKYGNAIYAKSDGLTGNYVLHTEGDALLDSGDVNITDGDIYVKGFIDLDSSNVAAAGPGSIRWDNNDFLGYDGTIWKSLTGGTQGAWGILGNNNISGINFIGTTNNQAVDFRTNNVIKVRITTKGAIETLNIGNSVFIGEGAGNSDDLTDNRNVFIGKNSGYSNSSGEFNVAVGNSSLSANSTGTFNTAIGISSLGVNTTGNGNSAFGANALVANSVGGNNVAVGSFSLSNNTTGNANVALGGSSLNLNTSGSGNTAVGFSALSSNTTSSGNVAVGRFTLSANTMGYSNTAIGEYAMTSNTLGLGNVAVGENSLYNSTTAHQNTSIGGSSLLKNTSGGSNVSIGYQSLFNNTTGNGNIAIGYLAGANITTGSNNIMIGFNIDAPSATVANQMSIGNIIFATGVDGTGTSLSSGSVGIGLNNPSSFYKLDIQGDVRLSPTSSSADFVVSNVGIEPSLLPSANNYGYVGSSTSRIYQGHFTNFTVYGTFTNLSDKKIKENIAPINGALTKILLLEGKTYDLKKEFLNDNANSSDEKGVEIEESRKNKIGFIAQDIEKILPELVHYNKESDLKSVDYIGLIPVLVEAIKEQNALIKNLEKKIEVSNK